MKQKSGMAMASMALVTGIVGIGFASQASAAAVNIDIQGNTPDGDWWGSNGTYASTAAAAGVGTTWNGVVYPNLGFAGALVDDQGTTSDIEMWAEGADHWAPPAVTDVLMGDYAFTGTAWSENAGERFTLFTDTTNGGSGMALDGSKTYDIYIYTVGDTAGQFSTFQLNHAGGTVDLSSTGDGPFGGTFVEGANYLKFSGVSPKAWTNGYEFEFFWGAASGSSTAALNGFQIVEAIPEPSAALLGGIGMLALLLRRRH